MNVKEIKELIDLVSRRGLSAFELERPGFRLRIEGARPEASGARPPARAAEVHAFASPEPVPALASAGSQALRAALPSSASATPSISSAVEDGLHYITSPIVGTFYRASNPDSEPFVKPGDSIEKGRTLCIIEAMKLMNEIESDVAGTLVEVYPKNGQPVEYGERLFSVRPR